MGCKDSRSVGSCVTLEGGTSEHFRSRLELKEQSLVSDAMLTESDSRSSDDSALFLRR